MLHKEDRKSQTSSPIDLVTLCLVSARQHCLISMTTGKRSFNTSLQLILYDRNHDARQTHVSFI